MTLTEAKLKAVRDWATPQDVKGVRSFSGFTNYYGCFVKDFAAIVDPPDIVNKEGRGVAVGALSTACLSAIEGLIMRCTNFVVPRP